MKHALSAAASGLALLAAPALAAPLTVTFSGSAADGPAAGTAFTAAITFETDADDTRRDETDATEFFGAILDFTLTAGGETVTLAGTDETRNFTQQDADGLTLSGNIGGAEDGQDALSGTLFGAEALGASFDLTTLGAGLLYDDQDALLSGVLAEMLTVGDFADLALTVSLDTLGGVAFAVEEIAFGDVGGDPVPLPGAAALMLAGLGAAGWVRRRAD